MSDKVKAKKANPPFKRTRKGRTRSSRVSSKNQVTIPVEILRQAGIAPNELVNFKFNKSGEIVISKEGSALESLFGALSGTYVDFDLRIAHPHWSNQSFGLGYGADIQSGANWQLSQLGFSALVV